MWEPDGAVHGGLDKDGVRIEDGAVDLWIRMEDDGDVVRPAQGEDRTHVTVGKAHSPNW